MDKKEQQYNICLVQKMLEEDYVKQLFQSDMRLKCTREWLRLYSRGETIWNKCRQKKIDGIIIYGIAEIAPIFVDFCLRENINVVGISDSKITVEGMDYKGIPFILPKNISKKGKDATVIITAMGYVEEIRSFLQGCGVENVLSLLELVE